VARHRFGCWTKTLQETSPLIQSAVVPPHSKFSD
jgi:hypothetical protein